MMYYLIFIIFSWYETCHENIIHASAYRPRRRPKVALHLYAFCIIYVNIPYSMTLFNTDRPFSVYRIYDKVDNILIYIGYTSNFYRRKQQHLHTKIDNHPVNRYIRYFSDYISRFEISIISSFSTKSHAMHEESHLIKTLNPWCNIAHSTLHKRGELFSRWNLKSQNEINRQMGEYRADIWWWETCIIL